MLLLQFQNIQSIEFFFLERGHTQNESNSIHSVEQHKGSFNLSSLSIEDIEDACKSKSYIKYPICQEDLLHFQIDMNDMYNFLINKSTKDVVREITNTTIMSIIKNKENQVERDQGSAPG